MIQLKTFHDPNGAEKTIKPTQIQNSVLETGGAGIQPRIKAKPVKNSNCQPKGLKNHSRSDQGSAGRCNVPILAAHQIAISYASAMFMITSARGSA